MIPRRYQTILLIAAAAIGLGLLTHLGFLRPEPAQAHESYLGAVNAGTSPSQQVTLNQVTVHPLQQQVHEGGLAGLAQKLYRTA